MKKYRLKVNSPWGKKGDIANLNVNGVMYYGQNTNVKPYPIIIGFTPDNFPEIFEEVIEPSYDEWFCEQLKNHIESFGYKSLAISLITNGFDVKKLRGES